MVTKRAPKVDGKPQDKISRIHNGAMTLLIRHRSNFLGTDEDYEHTRIEYEREGNVHRNGTVPFDTIL